MINKNLKGYGQVNDRGFHYHEFLGPKDFAMASTLLNLQKRRRLAYAKRYLENTDRREKEVKA